MFFKLLNIKLYYFLKIINNNFLLYTKTFIINVHLFCRTLNRNNRKCDCQVCPAKKKKECFDNTISF